MGIHVTFFIVILFLLLSVIISIVLKDILNPLLVLITPLSIQYGIYFYYISPVYLISDKTNLLFVISIASFTLGFLCLYAFPMLEPKTDKKTIIKLLSNRDFRKSKRILLFLGIVGFGVGIIMAFRYGLSGPGGFFFNLRYSNTIMNENNGGLAAYLLLFLQTITLAMIVFRKNWKIKTTTLFLLIALLLISAVFTMARTSLLMTITSVMGVYVLSNKYIYKIRVNKNTFIFAFVGFVFLAYLFALGTQKVTMDSNFFFDYLAYPLVTFDKWILDFPLESNGAITFPLFIKILSILGFDYTPINLGLYVGVPRGEFNTFTFMGAPYLDFKTGGLLFVFVCLGILFGFVYKRVRSGRPYWIIFYSILLYPLVISFFEYQFNLSTYVYYTLILIIVYLRGNIVKQKNKSVLKSYRI